MLQEKVILFQQSLYYKEAIELVTLITHNARNGQYRNRLSARDQRHFSHIFSVFLHIQSERWQIRTRKTLNTDTFHAVSAKATTTEKGISCKLHFDNKHHTKFLKFIEVVKMASKLILTVITKITRSLIYFTSQGK